MAVAKRALGRGLSALIPDEEMEVLRRVARDDSASENLASVSVQASSAGAKSGKLKKVDLPLKSEQARPELGASGSDAPGTPRMKKNSGFAAQSSVAQADPELPDAEKTSVGVEATGSGGTVTSFISVGDIEPNPYQPRRSFDEEELSNLAASIGEHGIIQPIVVRPSPGGNKPYQLVAGERRWRASQRAALQQIPAIVRPVNDLQALELALIENVQRHDISAIDAALAYRRLADDFRLSQEDIARRVGKSRSAVANTMRLLDLQPEIRKAIEDGHLSEGHGRAILLAQGDGARRALFRRISRDHLSVREVERLAKEKVEEKDGRATGFASENEQGNETKQGVGSSSGAVQEGFDAAQLAGRLEKHLGTRLKVQRGARGGRIIIEYSSMDELQRLAELLLPS